MYQNRIMILGKKQTKKFYTICEKSFLSYFFFNYITRVVSQELVLLKENIIEHLALIPI